MVLRRPRRAGDSKSLQPASEKSALAEPLRVQLDRKEKEREGDLGLWSQKADSDLLFVGFSGALGFHFQGEASKPSAKVFICKVQLRLI